MSDFYKFDPAAWDFGTANLSLEEEAAYLRIVNAIHKHRGPVPDNDRVLSGLFRSSTRKARSLVEALKNAGKIKIEDGFITNERAISDLVHRGFVSVSRSESGAKGGRTRAINAAKSLENKEPPQAIASTREEKRREEDTVANATGVPPSPDKLVFDHGLRLLTSAGKADGAARAMLGKWKRDHGAEALVVAIGKAQREGAIDPISFIEGCFRQRKREVVQSDFWTGPDLTHGH